MDPLSLSFPAVHPAPVSFLSPAELLHARMSALTAQSQGNRYLFASPLGPFTHQQRAVWLPRFVFFGPHASDESWRLAFLAGYDHRDLRSTHALLALIERLQADAVNGHGLNLTFFPLVDAAGLAFHTPARQLAEESWARSAEPEIQLLERDARQRSYHGFVSVETAPPGDDTISLRIREPAGFVSSSPDVEIVSSEEAEPFAVRFEYAAHVDGAVPGPLALADDLGLQPFELTLRIPDRWSEAYFETAVASILTRFIHRYRAFQAYGGHL